MRGKSLDWVAGFLEGEGCFVVQKPKKRVTLTDGTVKMYSSRYPAVSVVSTDKDALDEVAKMFGGNVRGPLSRNNSKWKDHYRLWLGTEKAYKCMKAVYPLMCKRRRATIAPIIREFRYKYECQEK